MSMSKEQKLNLKKIAYEYKLHILSDEIYTLLHFPSADVQYKNECHSYFVELEQNDKFDPEGRIISIGSLSKFVGPGLRVGWF
eukprot:UN28622